MFICSVLVNELIAPGYYRIVLRVPEEFASPLPGQFVQVLCDNSTGPLLRRPFSICSFTEDERTLSLVFRVVGQGTARLARLKAGDCVDVLGPLGNGFPLAMSEFRILVAGGVGVPPILFLASFLVERMSIPAAEIILLEGARSRSQLLCHRLAPDLAVRLRTATDDASHGYHGTVVDLLRTVMADASLPSRKAIYACGPYPMLREVASLASSLHVPAFLSMEAMMACGFGVCLGCVLPTRHGYLRCCSEGPVFCAEDIEWNAVINV